MSRGAADIPPTGGAIESFFSSSLFVAPGQAVTLYWSSGQPEAGYSFRLVQTGQPALLCSGADGAAGVQCMPLTQTSVFVLEAVGAQGVVDSQELVVAVANPIVLNGKLVSYFSTNRVVRLFWQTEYASSCSLLLDGTVVATGLSTDTSVQGYTYLLDGGVGAHQLALQADGADGATSPIFNFPVVQVKAETAVNLIPPNSGTALGVAVAADNQRVLASIYQAGGGTISENLSIVDASTGQITLVLPNVAGVRIAVMGSGATEVAVLPNGATIQLLNLATLTLDPPVTARGTALLIAAARNGTFAIPLCPAMPGTTPPVPLTVMSLSAEAVIASVPFPASPMAAAVASDGMRALIGFNDGTLRLLEVAVTSTSFSLTIVGGPLAGSANAAAVAITPDGTLGLVTDDINNVIWVVDLTTFTMETTAIAVGQTPIAIAISPDGTLALIGTSETALSVIDIAARSCVGTLAALSTPPTDIAIAPNGAFAAVTTADGRLHLL